MSRGKWNCFAVLWIFARRRPALFMRWLRHLASRRDALHAVKTDWFANADAFDAVAQKAFHFAGSAHAQHTILFQAPEGLHQVRLIFRRFQHPADLMFAKKTNPGAIGLQHQGIHLPTITRVAKEKRNAQVIKMAKEDQGAAGLADASYFAIDEFRALVIRRMGSQIILRW